MSDSCWAAVALLTLVGAAGCGGPAGLAEATGVVTVDGKPLSRGTVVFNLMRSSNGPVEGPTKSRSLIDPTGAFRLRTLVNGELAEGAVVGFHRVSVIGASPGDEKPLFGRVSLDDQPFVVDANGANRFEIELSAEQVRLAPVLEDD